MSVHAMIAAAYLEDLNPSPRLVLMAIADSSDEHTLEAAPGLPKLRAWSGLGRRQVLNVVAELKAAGYIEQTVKAHRGRRAVFRVFPSGIPAIPHPTEVAARYADETDIPNGDNPPEGVDNPDGKGATGRTQSERKGAISDGMGATAIAPLQSYPSVPLAPSADNPPARRVDKPTPSASTGSGFPGARRPPADDDTDGIRRRARGAMDRPCPIADHGDLGEIHGGCGRCAHAAATADPAAVDAARKAARDAIRTARTATTEEKSA